MSSLKEPAVTSGNESTTANGIQITSNQKVLASSQTITNGCEAKSTSNSNSGGRVGEDILHLC
jgi:hypothetical protein